MIVQDPAFVIDDGRGDDTIIVPIWNRRQRPVVGADHKRHERVETREGAVEARERPDDVPDRGVTSRGLDRPKADGFAPP
jgi:hypothetical protein